MGDQTPDASVRTYADIMREQNLARERDNTMQVHRPAFCMANAQLIMAEALLFFCHELSWPTLYCYLSATSVQWLTPADRMVSLQNIRDKQRREEEEAELDAVPTKASGIQLPPPPAAQPAAASGEKRRNRLDQSVDT